MKSITISRKTGEIIEQREFSSSEFLLGTIHTSGIVQQLVKLMNIYDGEDARRNLRHWIIETLQNVYLKNAFRDSEVNRLRGGYQSLFILNEDVSSLDRNKSIIDVAGNEFRVKIENGSLKCGEDWILEGIKRAEGEGGLKYGRYFRGLERDKDFIEAIRNLIKYISLTISGQITGTENFYDSKVTRLSVDYKRKNSYSIQEIRAIIIQCLIIYFDSNGLEYDPMFEEFTDPKFNG